MLTVKDLTIKSKGKKILKNVNLNINSGEIHVLLGRNGSGKSTLAKVLLGYPDYEIVQGNIVFKKNILNQLSTDKRAQLGIFLAFQQPVEVPGVTFRSYMRDAYNNVHSKQKQLTVLNFSKFLKSISKSLNISEELLNRGINENLSGGEKKKMEVLQMLILKPQLIVLDEADTGLDADALKIVFMQIKKYLSCNKKAAILIISHYDKVFEFIKPEYVHIIDHGEIISSGGKNLLTMIMKHGYKKIIK